MSRLLNRRNFIRGAVAAGLVASGATARHLVDTHNVDLSHVPIALGLSKPLRMAALGDFHFDPLCDEAYLHYIVHILNRLDLDVVAFLGDYVTEHATRCADIAAILAQTKSRFGLFAAIGNHEHLAGAAIVSSALTRSGIHVLRNDTFPLPGNEGFYLSGIDSWWGKPDFSFMSQTPADSRHILLAHEPDPFRDQTDPRIVLQISGHTHGGQIRVPFHGPILLPPHGRLYDSGLFWHRNRRLYVNRGVGTLPPFVRVDCRPEITLFELA